MPIFTIDFQYFHSLRRRIANIFNIRIHSFPRSDTSICAYTFRCLLWTCMLDCACNTIRYFITKNFTLPHIPHFCGIYISVYCYSRPVHSQVCQITSNHSHHRHFIDLRPIICSTFRGSLFLYITVLRAYSQPTSPSFWPKSFALTYANRSIRGSISRRYPVILLLKVPVLFARL